MEEIMKKVTKLYNALEEKSQELNAKEADLMLSAKNVVEEKASLKEREAALEAGEKRVKKVTDILKAETLLAARSAEVDLMVSNLNDARDKFEENARIREAAIEKRDEESKGIAEGTLATRQRLLVEVKKVKEMKAKYKEEVLAELAGRK